MTQDEKIDYMRIALGVCGFDASHEHLDLIVTCYEYVIEKKGDGNIKELSKLQVEVKNRANVKSKEEILNKVSKKV